MGSACTPEGCRALSEFVNVFVGENELGELGRLGATGSCSSMVYWNPHLILGLWQQVDKQDWESVDATCECLNELVEFLHAEFAPRGFTDTAFDRLGGLAGEFPRTSLASRGPYPSVTPNDVETLRRWYRDHFPEMLKL